MKFKLISSTVVFVFLLIISGCKKGTENSKDIAENQIEKEEEPKGKENIAHQWSLVAIDATANDTDMFNPRPTITSRFLGLIFTSMFDAWTRYDDKAKSVYLKADRLPENERTLKNKEIAISYAAYRAMSEYFYSDSTMFRNKMKELGLDPDNTSLDPTTPEGIGNLAAKTVIDSRRNDGSNQYGNVEGSNGKPYSDYTAYKPVNTVDGEIVDLNKWQPKYFSDGKGGKFAPGCATPYWQKVEPLLLSSSDQFRPGPPPMVGSEQLEKEVKEVVEMQANLTPENKALVEFMRDGPKSVQQAGHWLKFSQDVSRRDNHTLDQDIKMFFLVESVAMDGFIACWDSKMHYDYARPYALVHKYYQDQVIKAWGGPEAGMTEMKGQEWRPYSPDTFLCPPFPGYVSGHSTISGGCGEALKLFKGSDEFGEQVELIPGAMTEPDNLGDPVVLKFPTFTETANMAGISRVMGGYHIQADNIEGLELGRKIARHNYQRYLELIGEVNKTTAQTN